MANSNFHAEPFVLKAVAEHPAFSDHLLLIVEKARTE